MRMEMSMSCEFRYELRVCGGITQSIFPGVETMLHHTEYQKALEFVAAYKDTGEYRSLVDFLFCEIFTQYKPACFRFYRRRGRQQLRFLITEKQRAQFELLLVGGLQIAYDLFCERREQSWESFRLRVLRRTG